MNSNFSQKMFINYDIDRFVIDIDKSLKDAISLFGYNSGLPLIVVNNQNEFIGTLSNGDIRVFLSKSQKNIEAPIINAINKESKYCFDHYDKSIFDHLLSNTNIRIIPIIDKHKKYKFWIKLALKTPKSLRFLVFIKKIHNEKLDTIEIKNFRRFML